MKQNHLLCPQTPQSGTTGWANFDLKSLFIKEKPVFFSLARGCLGAFSHFDAKQSAESSCQKIYCFLPCLLASDCIRLGMFSGSCKVCCSHLKRIVGGGRNLSLQIWYISVARVTVFWLLLSVTQSLPVTFSWLINCQLDTSPSGPCSLLQVSWGGMHHLNHYSVIREYGVGCVPCREAAGDSLSGLSFQFRGPRPCHMRGLSDDTEF